MIVRYFFMIVSDFANGVTGLELLRKIKCLRHTKRLFLITCIEVIPFKEQGTFGLFNKHWKHYNAFGTVVSGDTDKD